MKHALVTGGAGFIGSNLTDELLRREWRVTIVDNLSTGSEDNIADHANNENLKFIKQDLEQGLPKEAYDADYVFHLAALADIVPSIEKPSEYFSANVISTQVLLEDCKKMTNLKKIVYAASSSCYGIPENYPTGEEERIAPMYPYAFTKWMAEELIAHYGKIYGINWISLRLFNVYGPRARTSGAYGAVMGVFLKQKLEGRPLTVVGDGEQSRDFTYVSDVVEALISVAESEISREVFNIGSGGTYKINHLAKLLGGNVEYIPRRPGEPDVTYADIQKIKSKLNWMPKVSFEEGVKNMVSNIEHWRAAPLWSSESIELATKSWFKYLSRN